MPDITVSFVSAKILGFINCLKSTGKTTSLLAISRILAGYGARVLMIDMDPQAGLTQMAGAPKPILGWFSLFRQDSAPDVVSISENLDLIPCTHEAALADFECNEETDGLELIAWLNFAAEGYEYVLIDTPASVGFLSRVAAAMSTRILIPLKPEDMYLQGLTRILEILPDNLAQQPIAFIPRIGFQPPSYAIGAKKVIQFVTDHPELGWVMMGQIDFHDVFMEVMG